MKTNNILYLLIIILSFSACRKDSHQIFEDDKNLTEEVFRQSNVTGLVLDENNQAVINADVTLGDHQTTTDNNGVFTFIDVAVSSKGSLIKIHKSSYFTSYRFVYNQAGIGAYVNVKLVEKKEVARYENETGKHLVFNDRAYLQLPPNAIAQADGVAHNGTVVVYAHYFDPEEGETMRTMPGDLRGTSVEDEQRQLATFGMFAVELETPAGLPLYVAEESEVYMNFEVSSQLLPLIEGPIPMWHFDEIDGYWKEEGDAYLDGNILSATINHFSFWNCDLDFPYAEIQGKVVSTDGIAIANQLVTIKVQESLLSGIGYTNNEGVFEGKVPANVPLSLHIEECEAELVMLDLGSIPEGFTDLGSIPKPPGEQAMLISGQMLGCMKQGLGDAYGILSIGNRTELILPNADGSFNHAYTRCGESSISLSLYDPVNNQFREALNVPINESEYELNEIDICNDIEEFMRYTINGDLDNILTNADVTIVDGKYLHIHAEDEATNRWVTVLFQLDPTGTYREWMHMRGLQGNGDLLYIETVDLSFMPSNNDGFGVPGDTIAGSFTSTNSPFDHEIEGNFSFAIDRIIETATISGTVWNDSNEDGIQDETEFPIDGIQVFLQNPTGGSPFVFYNEIVMGQSGEDGYYEWPGLDPGETYELTRSSNNLYSITTPGVGMDETKDSDFYQGTNNEYTTGPILVSEGEHIEHIGLGLITENTSCNYTVEFCAPAAELTIFMNGGTPPYIVNLSNGEMKTGDPVTFENLENGVYSYTIEDQTGTMCNGEATVSNSRNTIKGNVWADLEGGTPDVWDPATEFTGTTPFEIEISDLDGIPVDTFSTFWDVNFYDYDQGPAGTYRLRPLLSDAYELVQKDVGDDEFDSDIDPLTGYSEPFSFSSCDGEVNIDIGIKEK